ncbi:chlorophyll synthase ChlG [Falsiroseomonas tokyonensis]|uniref:Chlorophyll synthase ChlG n=1 Tax=Falsiroseomonas tokyonensis TaxID=430521 RepID=A0ABV7BYC5_9PROT|nr:chlorophyll synthase ChlG [Falsiroseomonas tokyonensis]MBU8540573.1 chlorophyll synthase ChlG [Falsiroseomonas tokyonensis]
MANPATSIGLPTPRLQPAAVLELLKPVTWFPPMWAFGCGVAASGANLLDNALLIALGVLLTGPMVCGMSQAVNDWFDRHVDAINEPNRPIPSGRIPGMWGLYVAILWTLASLAIGAALGLWGFAATVLAVVMAWIYSAPPLRLKQNGWWGNLACGLSYETLPWITAVAVLGAAAPDAQVVTVAVLYGLGAHGIMTLNDFKSIEGDTRFGLRSLPVILGAPRAARVACLFMAVPQAVVVVLLAVWDAPIAALLVAASLLAQLALMRKLLRDPRGLAPWYNGTGITLYVAGMMASAVALAP